MMQCPECKGVIAPSDTFCGRCGHTFVSLHEGATAISASQKLVSVGSDQETVLDVAATLPSGLQQPEQALSSETQQSVDLTEDDEEKTEHRKALIGLPILATLVDGQLADHVPTVQGTPQIGSVPTAQGAPTIPQAPSLAQHPGAAPALVRQTAPDPSQIAQVNQSLSSSAAPNVTPPTTGTPPQTRSMRATGGKQPKRTQLQPHSVSPAPLPIERRTPSVRRVQKVTKVWRILASGSIILAGLLGLIGILLTHPDLVLAGSSHVYAGGTLHVQGKGYIPGGKVKLSIDTRPSLASVNPPLARAHTAKSLPVAMNLLAVPESGIDTVGVDLAGNFDVTLAVNTHWSLGGHILHAVEDLGDKRANLRFSVDPRPAMLNINTSALDFGKRPQGSQTKLALLLGNSGDYPLSWAGGVIDGNWVQLQTTTGILNARTSEKPLYISIDTQGLSEGRHTSEVHVNSNGGQATVKVSVVVVPPEHKSSSLAITPNQLTFNHIAVGDESTDTLTLSNTGQQPLSWKLDEMQFPDWLTVSPTSGEIAVLGTAQTMQVTVNTYGMTPGTYQTQLQVSAGNESSKIGLTLIVAPSVAQTLEQPTPTPIVQVGSGGGRHTPTVQPTRQITTPVANQPKLTVDARGVTDGCRTCVIILSEAQGPQGTLSWQASSNLPGVSFSPAHGTVTTNQTVKVTVTVPPQSCPANATFTFSGTYNTLTVPWKCTKKAPEPLLSVSTHELANCQTCIVTLSEVDGVTAPVEWHAQSDLAGVTFTPSSGTLQPGHPLQVKITLPDLTCPAHALFSFIGSANKETVQWNCTPPPPLPILTVNPAQLTDGCISCVITLGEAEGAAGNLPWSVSSDLAGVTFTPTSGVLQAGQAIQVTVQMPFQSCPPAGAKATFAFTGPANTVNVQWSCSAPPSPALLAVTPNSINAKISCSYSGAEGATFWHCPVTVTNQGKRTVNWSATSSGLVGANGSAPSFVDAQGQPLNAGTLAAGDSVAVYLLVSDLVCPASGTVSFSGPDNVAVATWGCEAPTLTVQPTSLPVATCPVNAATVPVMLTNEGQGGLNWTAASSVANTIFTPAQGTLYSSASVPVTVTFPVGTRSAQLTFIEAGGSATTLDWNCTSAVTTPTVEPTSAPVTTPTPAEVVTPTPEITPTVTPPPPPQLSVSAPSSDCPVDSQGRYGVCTLIVQETAGSVESLTWTASAQGPGVIFTPPGGTLSPGQAIPVTILIPLTDCPGTTLTFSGPNNSVSIQWVCRSLS